MIEKRTIVDQIEVVRSGHIQIRFGLLLIEDGVEIDCKWHRTSVEPGGDVDAQIAAVNGHLAQMGRPSAPVDELARVTAIVRTVHTPKLVAEFKATKQAAIRSNVPKVGP